MLLQLLHRKAVCPRSLLTPLPAPKSGATNNGVGGDRVDANSVTSAFLRQTSGHVMFRGLGRGIGNGVGTGGKAVLRAIDGYRPAQPLLLHHCERCAARQEVSSKQHVVD